MSRLKGTVKAKARKRKQLLKNKHSQNYREQLLSLIKTHDDPFLLQKCELFVLDEDCKEDILNSISKMKKVLGVTQTGVGLAANQIGVTKQIIVYRKTPKEYNMSVMINPEIISHSENKNYGIERCLSFPGVSGIVERWTEIEVGYLDTNFKQQTKKFLEGELETTIIQHEIEHLQEGCCSLYEWWKNPEEMQKRFIEEKNQKENLPSNGEKKGYEVVKSEDKIREEIAEDTVNEETDEAIKELELGKGFSYSNVEELLKDLKK